LSNDTILETNANSTNSKKNITVSSETYDRLVSKGKFSDRTFDHLISRLLDEREQNAKRGNY
jgi:predicted CopG family antitoxin